MNKLLYPAAFAVSLGYSMLTPYVGMLEKSGMSGSQIGIIFAAYPLAKVVGFLSAARGFFVEKLRLLLLFGACGYLLMGLSFSTHFLIAGRIIEGFVFGWFLGFAAIRIAARGQAIGEGLAWLNGLSAAGVFAGPILAGIAIRFGFGQLAFIFAAALTTAIAISLKQLSPETKHNTRQSADIRSALLPIVLLISLFFLFDQTYGFLSIAIPIRFQDTVDNGATITAAVFAIGFLIFLIVMPIFGKLFDKGYDIILPISVITIAASFITLSFRSLPDVVFLIILFVEFVAAGAAYAGTSAAMGRLRPNGIAYAGAVQSIGLAFGALMAGALVESELLFVGFAGLGSAYLILAVGCLAFARSSHLTRNERVSS